MHPIPELPWSRVATFVRQHTHDVRNDLNSLDLETSLLAEIVTDAEAKESLTRMRRQIREAAAHLKALAARFADPSPIMAPIAVKDVFEIWKEQLTGITPAMNVSWDSRLGDECVSVDANLLSLALRELLLNAASFNDGGLIAASGYINGSRASFELREAKREAVEPAEWQRSPLQSSRRGGYGLGLYQTKRIVEALGGELQQCYEPGERLLISIVRLPLT